MPLLTRNRIALSTVFAAMAVAALVGCAAPPAEAPANTATPAADAAKAAPAAAPAADPVERGRVLVQVGGCHDCHTPKKFGPGGPEPDMTKALSGHPQDIEVTTHYAPAKGSAWTIATNDHLTAWSGAWGISFAANITPDPGTGIRMTERNFLIAMKTGSHLGTARPILPPMPWQMYSKLSDDDLKAIYAFLQSLPPINNNVPAPIPPPGK
jgi:mono/diheme cytochrome c family protein